MRAYLCIPVDELDREHGFLTVADWSNYWLENIKLPMVEKSSERGYRSMVRIINNHIGSRNLKTTTKMMLQMIINARAEEGKNTSFLRNVICECFRTAYECGFMDANITKGLRYKDNPTAIKKPLTREEDIKMSEYIAGKPLENEIIFLRQSACRISEMCGLTWDMVYADEGYVMIAQQKGTIEDKHGVKKQGIIHSTKNKMFAPVYMPKCAFDALENERKWQQDCAKKNGKLYENKENYVFTNEFGKPYSQKQINAFIKEIGNEIGRPELSAHYFRHTRASEVYKNTGDPLIVQKLLRHVSLEVTFRYLHTIEGYGLETVKALQEDHERSMETLNYED